MVSVYINGGSLSAINTFGYNFRGETWEEEK